jgi:hypothetical protein
VRGNFIFRVGGLRHEHVVDREPNLGLNFAKFSLLMRFNFDPFLIFKFLLFSLAVFADPGLLLEQGHKHQGNICGLHELVNDRSRERLHVVGNESNQGEASHGHGEVDLFVLIVQHLFGSIESHLFGVLRCHIVRGVFSHGIDSLSQAYKSTVAVID